MNKLANHLDEAGDLLRQEPTYGRPPVGEIRSRGERKATTSRLAAIAIVAVIAVGGVVALNSRGGGQQLATSDQPTGTPAAPAAYPPTGSTLAPTPFSEMPQYEFLAYIDRVISDALNSQGIETDSSLDPPVELSYLPDDSFINAVWRSSTPERDLLVAISNVSGETHDSAGLTDEQIHSHMTQQAGATSSTPPGQDTEEADRSPANTAFGEPILIDDVVEVVDSPWPLTATTASPATTDPNPPLVQRHLRAVEMLTPTFNVYVETLNHTEGARPPVTALEAATRIIAATLTENGFDPSTLTAFPEPTTPGDTVPLATVLTTSPSAADDPASPGSAGAADAESVEGITLALELDLETIIDGAFGAEGVEFTAEDSTEVVKTQPLIVEKRAEIGGVFATVTIEGQFIPRVSAGETFDDPEYLSMPQESQQHIVDGGRLFSYETGTQRHVGLFSDTGLAVTIFLESEVSDWGPNIDSLQEIALAISAGVEQLNLPADVLSDL